MTKYKVKNISTGDFILTLNEVTKGKKFELAPQREVVLTEEEMNYLSAECRGAFDRGYLEVVSTPTNATVEIEKSTNALSDIDMDKILAMSGKKIVTALGEITETHVLKTMRIKAEELNKSSTIMDAIDKRISETATSAVL